MQPHSINPSLNTIVTSLFRVSAKLLVIQDSKLLVVEEDQGWYGLPGGGVDHGELIVEGLAREISEEIGIAIETSDVSSLPIFIDSTAIFDGIPRFTLLYSQRTGAQPLSPSHSELRFRWVDLNEFNALALAPNILPMRDFIIKLMANMDSTR